MTLLDALVFVLSTSTVPMLLAVFSGLRRNAYRRAASTVLLMGLGLNVQLATHPWSAWPILAVACLAAAVPLTNVRYFLLLTVAIGGPFVLRPGIALAAGRYFVSSNRTSILLVSSGLIFATLAGSFAVEATLKRIKGLPVSSEEAEEASGAPAGGRIIGMLERAFVFGGVLVGHPEVVALVVAIKSVARFPEFKGEGGRRFAEYFLIGTFVSLLFALAVAYLIKSALIRS